MYALLYEYQNIMKQLSINIHYTEYASTDELNEADRLLLLKAEEAVQSAYAPYSGFKVGAAVLLDNNIIVTGSNQENAAYPSGLCAERVALYAASAQYPDMPFKAIAITAKAKTFTIASPVSPCGACRQVMAEYENRAKTPLKIILRGETGSVIVFENVSQLLPFVFTSEQLNP